MKEVKLFEERIKIPEGTDFTLDNSLIKIKGKKGQVERRLSFHGLEIKKQDSEVVISFKIKSRKEKKIIKTYISHIKNLIQGASNGFTYKLKICSGHFPISVKIEKDKVIISNFSGEKVPRKSKILDNVAVSIQGDIIKVESPDIEKAGQTAANLEAATKIKNKDRRVFQDGIVIIERP